VPSSLQSPASSLFSAGFGRSDITPRVGVQLGGFGPYLNRHSTGIHAPLYARAAAFTCGSERCLILSLELCGLTRSLLERIRQTVSDRTNLPGDHIVVACTHTHSSPATAGHIGWGHSDGPYTETLPQRASLAAEAACHDLGEVQVGIASPACEGIAINRDYDTAYDRTLPVDHFLAVDWRPSKPEKTDTTCTVITFREGNRLKGFISTFGCHPVVCCERPALIHGDFVGQATNQTEAHHPGSIGLFLAGALGDVNPCVSHRPADESLRALEVVASRYANALEIGIGSAKAAPEAGLAFATRHVVFPRVDWTRNDVEARIATLEESLHQPGITDDPIQGEDPMERTGMKMVRLAGLRKILRRMDRGEDLNPPVELSGVRIGPLRLLGSPFEVFQQTKIDIRSVFPDLPVAVLSLVNGAEGYAPDPTIFEQQGYAAEFVPLMKGDIPHQCLHDLLVTELTQLASIL
jgi:hypothetical protein